MFEEKFSHADNLVEDTTEPPPPGCEDNIRIPVRSHLGKFQYSVSNECIPKISECVVTAIFRQRLHEDVIREWKLLFLDCFLNQFLLSWRASRKHYEFGSHKVCCSPLFVCPSPPSLSAFVSCQFLVISAGTYSCFRMGRLIQRRNIQEMLLFGTYLKKNQGFVPIQAQQKFH